MDFLKAVLITRKRIKREKAWDKAINTIRQHINKKGQCIIITSGEVLTHEFDSFSEMEYKLSRCVLVNTDNGEVLKEKQPNHDLVKKHQK